MTYRQHTDPELEESTNRVMLWGAFLLAALVLAFPLYRIVEPAARDEARAVQLRSLEEQGSTLYQANCAACHGLNGEGTLGPALNAQEFLQSATDEQSTTLIAVGIPGSQMNAFSLDHGGSLTSEQIKAIVAFLRSWEEDAPERPDWRDFPFE